MKPTGFTLSELLIALALLGLIATFTLPKVLQSTENAASKAKLKDTIAIAESIFINGLSEGRLKRGGNNYYSLFKEKLNYKAVCPGG